MSARIPPSKIQEAPVEPTGARERQKAETRARVLAAARLLFLRDGFDPVTIKAIAEEAKVAVGSVFTTFASKHELLDEITIEDLHRANAEGARAAAEFPPDALIERILAFGRVCLRQDMAKRALLGPTMAGSWMRSPESEARVNQAIAPAARIVHSFLRDAAGQGVTSDNGTLRLGVEMILTLFFTNYRHTVYGEEDETALLARFEAQVRIIVQGLRARA